MMQNLDVLFDVSLNKLLNKQSSGWWLVMPSCLCVTTVMFWSWTDNNPFHHRSYWCHGAKAPGHQYLQRRLTIYSIGPPVSYRNILYTGNNIRKRNVILKKIPSCLTHWGLNKMVAVSLTTLSNAFSWMKMLGFWLKFHWSLFLGVQWITFRHWIR